MTTGARIQIDRAKGGRTDKLRAYAVVLDGVKVARVKRGETCTIETDAGPPRSPSRCGLVPKSDGQLRAFSGPGGPVEMLAERSSADDPPPSHLGRANYIGLELVEVTLTSMI